MAIQPSDPAYPFTSYGIALNAPATSGVYAICDASGNYLYFGESNDIQRRLSEHLNDPYDLPSSSGAALFAFEEWPTEALRVARQNVLIAMYSAPCNQRFG